MTTILENLFKNGFSKKGNPINLKSLNDIRDFNKNTFEKQKTITIKDGSYKLKHVVENKILKNYFKGNE